MKPEIVALSRIYGPAMAELQRAYVVHDAAAAADPMAFLRANGANVRGAVTTGLVGCSREQMEALPKLEIIACFGTPRRTIDYARAAERGIVITNTPDAITDPVADIALGLLLAAMRRISASDRFVRAGKWPHGLTGVGTSLGGKTCGIVGFGRIGKAVAKRVEACGMAVCWHGPRAKPDVAYPYYADLEAMARAADCLVVACPSTPATRKLINRRILDALGPDGFLVNVSRGAVVDEAELVAALTEQRIAGAGLDVFEDEPNVPTALFALDNVVLSPHVGSHTREIREERGRKMLANLRAHFAGEPVPHPLSQAVAERD